jgi:hypothetical protein
MSLTATLLAGPGTLGRAFARIIARLTFGPVRVLAAGLVKIIVPPLSGFIVFLAVARFVRFAVFRFILITRRTILPRRRPGFLTEIRF